MEASGFPSVFFPARPAKIFPGRFVIKNGPLTQGFSTDPPIQRIWPGFEEFGPDLNRFKGGVRI